MAEAGTLDGTRYETMDAALADLRAADDDRAVATILRNAAKTFHVAAALGHLACDVAVHRHSEARHGDA